MHVFSGVLPSGNVGGEFLHSFVLEIFQHLGRVFLARTVIEDGRRRDHGQLDVDGNGMALISPDLRLLVIEGIALLVVCAHDFFQDFFIDRILPADAGQQFFHIGPAVPVQSHAGHPGLMAQDEAEVAADTR